MKSIKSVIAMLLVAVMVFSDANLLVFAQDEEVSSVEETNVIIDSGTCGDNATWSLSEDGTLTISGTGETEHYELFYQRYIPWYSYRENIESIVIEEGITGLGNTLFVYCENLTSVSIADSVTYIGVNAFSGCISLKEITIPKGVEEIDSFAFTGCTSMLEYKVAEGNEYFTAINGSLLSKDETRYYNYPIGVAAEEYVIPSTVTEIMPYAFSEAVNLKRVTFPQGLKTIGDEAFWSCYSLEAIELFEGLEYIGGGVFQECRSLASIILPSGITHIGAMVFQNTPFANNLQNWENNVLYYNEYLLSGTYMYTDEEEDIFEYSSFEGDLIVQDDTVLIAQEAFSFCDVTSVSFPDTLQYICYGAFYGTLIASVELTGAVSLEEQVFYYCENLETVALNSGITHLGYEIFGETPYVDDSNNYTDGILYHNGYVLTYNSSLASNVELSDDTVLIADNAFAEATISDITLPASVKYVGNEAFVNCSQLKEVTIPETVEEIGNYAYGYTKKYDSTIEEYVYTLNTTFTIKGYDNTSAQEYAEANGINFESLSEKETTPPVELGAPENVSTTFVGQNNATITWDAVEGADGYHIYYKTSLESSYNEVAETTTETSFTYSDLTDNVSYDIKVVPYILVGDVVVESDNYAEISFTTLRKLDAPVNAITTQVSYDNATITWEAVEGADGYHIYYKTSSETSYNEAVETTTETNFTYSNLADNVSYDIKIVPYFLNGDTVIESDNYAEISFTTLRKLDAPEHVTATLTGHNDATVTWDKVEGADGYHIYYKKSSADEYNTTFKTTTETSCKYSNLAANTSYDIKVVPYMESENGVLESPNSTVVKLTTLRDLAAPTVTVALTAHDDVKVSWKSVSYAEGYYVYYKTSSESSYSSYKITTGTSITIKDLDDNAKYTFKVIPYGLSGSTKIKSDNYTTKTISTLRNLKAPTVTVKLTGHDDVKVSWKAVSYAEGYYVYYKKASASSYKSYKTTTGTSVTIKGLSANTSYNFKVVPYGLSGSTKIKSDNSTTKTIKTLRDLAKPSKLTLTASSKTKIKASWSKVSYAEGYYVYYKKSSASSYKLYKTTTGTSITISGLTKNTKYTIKIVPYGISNSSKVLSDNYITKSVTTKKK